MEEQFSSWQRRIDCLCYGHKIDPERSTHFEPRDELLQRAGESIEFPDHEDINRTASVAIYTGVLVGIVICYSIGKHVYEHSRNRREARNRRES